MGHPLRIGIKNSGQETTIQALLDVWQIADQAGFDHVWDFDHLASIGSAGSDRPVFEGWSLLAAMALATKRVRVGVMVTGNTYRHPALLAKMAVTVDHLSGGRLEFGIGAAWAEIEHRMLGIEGLDHRVGRLRESLDAIISLWTKDRTTVDGRYYQFKDAIANPKPLQQPHPPIWIGGGGAQVIQVAARYADVWNVAGTADLQQAGVKSRQLDEAAQRVGRHPSEIRRSCQHFWDGRDRGQLLDLVGRYFEHGFSEQIIVTGGMEAGQIAGLAAEALPELRSALVR